MSLGRGPAGSTRGVVRGGPWDSQSRGASDSIGSAGGGIIGGGPIAPGYPPGGRICDAIGSANLGKKRSQISPRDPNSALSDLAKFLRSSLF